MKTLKPVDILINSHIIKRFISTLSKNKVPAICTFQENSYRYNSTNNKERQPAIPPPKEQTLKVQRPKIIVPKGWETGEMFTRERCKDGTYPWDTHGNMLRGLDTDELKEILKEPENIRAFFKAFPGEYKKLKELLKDYAATSPLVKDPEKHIEMLFTFDSEEKIENFNVTVDADHDVGHSKASLTMTKHGSGLFSGYICNKLKPDGMTHWAGYANMNSKRATLPFWIPSYYKIEDYNHFVFKVRGDGRNYTLILATPGYYMEHWGNHWSYVLCTRGGPYWQISKIPFSKFYSGAIGQLDFSQELDGLQSQRVARFGITLADGVEGPFSLEIDYIGLQNKAGHYEDFAYEEYRVPYPAYA